MNELFQRPANYWLRHADRHKQNGDLVRAAVLQRHAVRAEPDSDAAHMHYALTLRQLHCYEASNREAFCALAAHPDWQELYGLIGCNFLNMGLRKEGLDALDHYMRANISTLAPWHEEACDMSEAYDYPFHEKKRQARLDGLLGIATRRIARGDLDSAGRALERAHQTPYQGQNARRELTMSVYRLHRRDVDGCFAHLQKAIALAFTDVPTLASAALLSRQLNAKSGSRMLLVSAASMASTPMQEQMVCHTAAQMGTDMLMIAYAMLKRALQHRADRCPLLYDLCVCALKLGRMQEAAQYIHLCREIDPDDVPSEWLFAQVMTWQQANLTPAKLRRAAREIAFYGVCTAQALTACADHFVESLQQGPQALAQAILADERLRRQLLFLLTLPLEWPVRLLAAACAHLPAANAEALLREVLMQHAADSAAKRYAMSALRRMGAPAPYASWSRDRFLLVDPEKLYAPVPSFRQRMLTRRIRETARLCGTECIPWALQLTSRMTRAQHNRMIGDHWKIWPLALAMCWTAMQGLPPIRVPVQSMSTLRLAALKDALRTIHHLRGGNHHADY